MPKISIIMPSLNVADYIRESVESVISQTLTDIEILCIDAGSTDGTLQILEKYARQDPRIQIIHSDKKSYGYQINLGIDMALGEYLGIVETDDYIAANMYEELYKTAEERNLDFVKAGFDVFVTPGAEESYHLSVSLPDCNQVISSEYFTERELSSDIYIWNGIYKLSFLREHGVRLNESPGAAFQDSGFRYLADINLRRGMFLDQSFYRYRRDNGSSSTYNPNCVKYNLAECRYLRRRIEEDGITERKIRSFIARETVMMALEPYLTFRGVGEPDDGTREALDEFRRIIRGDREAGLLRQEEMFPKHWLEMRLFTENPEAFEAYITICAEARYAPYRHFIRKMSGQKQIVVFGAGKVAAYALCLMRMNGIETIQAFCDNDQTRWGSQYLGYAILSPEEALRRYPKAHYLITNRAHGRKIREQIGGQGVTGQNVSVYSLPLLPMESTNYFMKLYE
ncbi:MAG: glycosyltransferase [Lachnospiraceae bacterium]|jgi:glycosyltransferase involved in cell wall biosynthesis|nr:glycosyltransferase [Lachnospiraceae bacterium]